MTSRNETKCNRKIHSETGKHVSHGVSFFMLPQKVKVPKQEQVDGISPLGLRSPRVAEILGFSVCFWNEISRFGV